MLSGISKRLRLVILAIVVFSVLSFAGAGIKSPGSDDDLPGPFRIDAEALDPTDLALGTECVRDGREIVVPASCEITLQPELLPHELRMGVVLGTPRVIVRQRVRGVVPSPLPSPTFGPGQTFRVSAAGEGDIVVAITCQTPVTGCRLVVLD